MSRYTAASSIRMLTGGVDRIAVLSACENVLTLRE